MTRVRSPNIMPDYYEVLRVAPEASTDEIRRSFKRLVLEFHPDKNPKRREWSERRIRELLEAFDVLGDDEKRQLFDQRQRPGRRSRTAEPFFFRKKTPGARALMVLHLLLNGGADDAVGILEEQEEKHGEGFLEKYLERRDYLDSLFLLAEYFLEKKEYLEAVGRLKEFYRLEKSTKFQRHYFGEVRRILKDLYLRKLPRVLAPQPLLDYLREVGDFELSSKEDLLRLKKVAEAQARLGDQKAARKTLSQIQARDPNSKGLERIEALLAAS